MTPAGQAQNLRFRKAPGSENVVLTPTAVTLVDVSGKSCNLLLMSAAAAETMAQIQPQNLIHIAFCQ